jgi:hypothetical protein
VQAKSNQFKFKTSGFGGINFSTPTDHKTQLQIFNTILGLSVLPKVILSREVMGDNIRKIFVSHEQVYVPDFELEWCPVKKHYRVYICVASRENGKEKSSYCICTISNRLAASGFSVLYQFLHKHRANNKSSA